MWIKPYTAAAFSVMAFAIIYFAAYFAAVVICAFYLFSLWEGTSDDAKFLSVSMVLLFLLCPHARFAQRGDDE